MGVKIALAGNPNSGKTTLFNALTGSNQFVGNWPGVTVEKKEGRLKDDKDVTVTDLPGIYSLSPYTLEEVVARNYLIGQRPDAILNIVDGTNLERNLYLSTQLMELGIPVVMAVNMMDVVKKSGDQINTKILSEKLGCEVVSISALKGEGIKEAASKAVRLARANGVAAPVHEFAPEVEAALDEIETMLTEVPEEQKRFYAIKLFERDDKIEEQLKRVPEVEGIIAAVEKEYDDDAESIITNERYNYIASVIRDSLVKARKEKLTTSDKIDRIVTNRILALPIFAAVMYLVYFLSIQTVGTMWTNWANDVLFGKYVPDLVTSGLDYLQVQDWLKSLIVDGIVAGIGTVLGFLPQIFVLFICLGVLEDIGYMSRIAFVMDRIFRRFGLSGKSFIPMLISTGCGVPAVMSSRTIENERDRRITIMTTTFMPCSAKLEIIALIAGAFFPSNSLVAPSTYFIGMAAIILSGIALKKTSFLGGLTSPFIMELPAYHWPKAMSVLRYAFGKAMSFVKRAGTIIFSLTVLIWFMSNYNFTLHTVDTEASILATLGKGLSWIFDPLGFGNWKATVAALTGLAAKETVVATFGILYHNSSEAGLAAALRGDYSSLAAYSFLIFNLLCAPCFAAIGAIKREMANLKWTVGAIGFQTGLAYCVSLILYQFGQVILYGKSMTIWTFVAFLLLVTMIYFVVRKPRQIKDQIISLDNLREAHI